jgi:Flp pilus assembly protein TadG
MEKIKLSNLSEKGSNLIEMALASALLLLILGGVVDFGQMFSNYIIITNATREAARYASHFPADETGIKQAAITEAADSGVQILQNEIDINGLGATSGAPIRVDITHDYPIVMAGIIGNNDVTIVSSTEMIIFGLDPPAN